MYKLCWAMIHCLAHLDRAHLSQVIFERATHFDPPKFSLTRSSNTPYVRVYINSGEYPCHILFPDYRIDSFRILPTFFTGFHGKMHTDFNEGSYGR